MTPKLSSIAAAVLALASLPASAVTVWTNWTSATVGAPGSAVGTLGGVGVSYNGEVLGNTLVDGGFVGSWAPATSYIGGTVDTSPASVGDIITLDGTTFTNAITFASPITNPVFAIWSLGQPALAATITFNAIPVVQSGGPNVNFGGSAITASGATVSGNEGNGVVQFNGTFSSIAFTASNEFYYGFTVGQNGESVPAIPEPQTWALMLAGLAAMAVLGRRRPG